ncbi:MAG: hypothetical protein DWQ31_01305 [Planctomycetota bacterium]|nr:MAG: hypothetical protein DWQ31_01305 [Planctomycetota bacterium]REJ95911.1 MAG: hypothetical protein DWQ35_05570 [Planctomycetota bacterium]
MSRCRLLSVAFLMSAVLLQAAAGPSAVTAADYEAVDGLKYVLIDTSETESFLSHRHDTTGRLFVGGREALFVYEPRQDAVDGPLYGERQLLYRFPNHTWIYDLAIRGDDIYVLTMSALYVVKDARVKREGLTARRLMWGIPLGHVHQCFHGLAWGPEDDLYLVTGDPTWYLLDPVRPDHWGYWTYFSQPEGTRMHWNGVGGAFRLRPDGTRLQVVATGLRNSCGLAFDEHFNLFTNDNDHEGNPIGYVPGRLLHLTPGADLGWPRGWMMFKTPQRRDIVRTMFEGMGRAVPVGQTYYNEPQLPERFRHNLVVARWGARKVTRYPLLDRGASFRTRELDVVQGRDLVRPVGVSVGRGGRLFATISYMRHNEGSPTYKSDLVMITGSDDAAPYLFDSYDAVAASVDRLFDELKSDHWWRRYRAHVELNRRGGPILEEAAARLEVEKADSPRLIHLVHLAAASRTPEATTALAKARASARPEVRQQVYRALAEYSELGAMQAMFVEGLADEHPRVQLAALEGLFRFDGVPAEVLSGPAVSDDSYLRQTAVRLLVAKLPPAELAKLCEASDPRRRLAGVLATGRRLTVRPATAPLPDEVPLGDPRGPVVNLDGEEVDLRDAGRIGTYRIKDFWKHAPRGPDQQRLFALLLARLEDDDEIVRLQAATFLNLLDDERSNAAVSRVRAASERSRLTGQPWQPVAEVATCGPFPNRPVRDSGDVFGPGFGPEQRPIDLAESYDSGRGPLVWSRRNRDGEGQFSLAEDLPADPQQSAYVYFQIESGQQQTIELDVGAKSWVRVWHNGSVVWSSPIWFRWARANNVEPRQRIEKMQSALPIKLRAGSNTILLRLIDSGEGPPPLAIRSLEPVVARVPSAEEQTLAARLEAALQAGEAAVPAVFFEYDWVGAVADGDVARGRQLFTSIGCNKCHATRGDVPVAGGPSLADARARFSPEYLAESVLVPSRNVSPLFRATLIVDRDGRQHRGLVLREDANRIELLQGDAKIVVVEKSAIEEREETSQSPMPAGLVKTPEELRDILAYLLAEGM